jgi:hypothetical protein
MLTLRMKYSGTSVLTSSGTSSAQLAESLKTSDTESTIMPTADTLSPPEADPCLPQAGAYGES